MSRKSKSVYSLFGLTFQNAFSRNRSVSLSAATYVNSIDTNLNTWLWKMCDKEVNSFIVFRTVYFKEETVTNE